jgi:hypothetical protein
MLSSTDPFQEDWLVNTDCLFYSERSLHDPNKTLGERFIDGSITSAEDKDLNIMNGQRYLFYFPWHDGDKTLTVESFVSKVISVLSEQERFALMENLIQVELQKKDKAFCSASLAQVFLCTSFKCFLIEGQEPTFISTLNYLVYNYVLKAKKWDLSDKEDVQKLTHFISFILRPDLEHYTKDVVQTLCEREEVTRPRLSSSLLQDVRKERIHMLSRIKDAKHAQDESVSLAHLAQIEHCYLSNKMSFFSYQSDNTAKLFKDLNKSDSGLERRRLVDDYMSNPSNRGRRAYRIIQSLFTDRYPEDDVSAALSNRSYCRSSSG